VADLRSQFLAKLFETDPARTIQMMDQWQCRHYSNETKAFKEWIKKDPLAAAEAVAKAPGKDGGVHYLRWIGNIWAETNPAAALQYAAGKSGRGAEKLMETVLKHWAQKDLKAAAEGVGQISDIQIRNRASASIVGALAKNDVKAAMAWVEQNLRGTHQRNAMTSIMAALTEQSPPTAQQFIGQLEPGPLRSQALRAYLNNDTLFNMEPAAASEIVKWISSLPDEQERSSALADALPFVLRKAPEAIHEVMSKPSVNTNAGLLQTYAHHLASTNPAAALKWVETVPAAVQGDLLSSILFTWGNQRPAEAMDWVRQQPKGPAKDALVQSMSRELAMRSFDATLPVWLEALPAADRKTALQSLESMALPPEKRALLEKWK
jgi:hypothetical protein